MKTNDSSSDWLTVAGSLLAMTVGNGPVMQLTFGVFLKPLAQDLDVGRDTISLALLCGLMMTAFTMPLVGVLLDRFGVHRVVLPAVVLLAAALASVGAFVSSPLLLIAIYGVMGVVAAGHTPIPYAMAVSDAFSQRRGLALGVAMTGVGLGTVIIPQFVQVLIDLKGWRCGYVGLASLLLLIAVPAVVFMVRDPRRAVRRTSGLRANAAVAFQSMRTKTFFILGITIFFLAATSSGVIAHVVALMADHGLSSALSTSALSTLGMASIVGRLIAGYMLDRVSSIHVTMACVLVQVVGLSLMLTFDEPSVVMTGVLLVGLAFGAIVNIMAFVTSRFFDIRAFAQIYGNLFAIFLIGSGVGPVIMGVGYARTGDYRVALICLALSLAGAFALLTRLGTPPRVQVEVTA